MPRDNVRIFLVISTYFAYAQALLKPRDLPNEMARCLQMYHKSCTIEDEVGLSILHQCLSEYKWKPSAERRYPAKRISREGIAYCQTLAEKVKKGQTQTEKVRKEYRMLSDEERRRYHNAIRELKKPNNGGESRYDMLVSFHTGDIEQRAHFGCHFPGWHRMYLNIYEGALQEIDPSVTLPYWDSTIDQYMGDNSQSVMFSAKFMGNGNGDVVSGPAANWTTSSGVLRRNIGVAGELFLFEEIENITSQTRHMDICSLSRDVESNGLEFHHGDIHLWVGGNMAELETAADDPIFFMHHANVDRIWEMQRSNARAFGTNVENDYPTNALDYGNEYQAPDEDFGLLTNLRVKDGLSNNLIKGKYRYDPSPSCHSRSRNCGSDQLKCVQYSEGYICISKTLHEYENDVQKRMSDLSWNRRRSHIAHIRNTIPWETGITNQEREPNYSIQRTGSRLSENNWLNDIEHKTGSRILYPEIDQCSAFQYKPIQNSFCANQKKDITEWVYIPVRIISQRDPAFEKYDSYPVQNGNLQTGNDIYSLSSYSELKSTLNPSRPQCYQKCRSSQTGAGEIFVRSDGISYSGNYMEYTIVDQRLPVSVAVAYVAVKNPKKGKESVVVSAYDSCGRVCRPSCYNARKRKYEQCSGALDITSRSPKLYADSLGDSIMNLFDFKHEGSPKMNNDQLFLSFHCDYSGKWPWQTALRQRITSPRKWKRPSYGLSDNKSGGQQTNNCQQGWLYFRDHCYDLERKHLTWMDAKVNCEKKSAYLLAINDEHEQNWIINSFPKQPDRYWTGGNDLDQEGHFTWVNTGLGITYTNWNLKGNEPDNKRGNQHCLQISTESGLWRDKICYETYQFICERKARRRTTGCTIVACSSIKYKYSECAVTSARTPSMISVQTKFSRSSCELNDSYGLHKNGNVWVNKGCRAKFIVC